MSLAPTELELLARARADLRMGVPVVLVSGDFRALTVAAETLSAGRLAAFRELGAPHVALTRRRADTLKVPGYDGALARIAVPEDADIGWIRALADPADDLRMPLKGPLRALRGGDADLSRIAIALTKSAHLLPAALVVESTGAGGAGHQGLTVLDAERAGRHLHEAPEMHHVVSARLPLEVSQAGRLHVFRPDDGSEEHYAVEIGRPGRQHPVLVRLHSACFTGDLLGSLKCDCGHQLRCALRQMGEEGAGVLLYLNQEGRGIGLANKMRAYSLQDQGFDTVEANHRLGFEDDERNFRTGAEILKALGIGAIRLLTNNPRKVDKMREHGISVVERVPLRVGENPQNARYLQTKARKSGHLL